MRRASRHSIGSAARSLALGWVLCASACGGGGDDGAPPGPGGFDTTFGGSSFGAWINDDLGLPAFRYDGCADAACADEPADVLYPLGNGAVTAVAHGDGHVELFTARTFYRFANRWDEPSRNLTGGFGWVRDGETVWSTFYDDRPPGASYERVFGMGYFAKAVEHGGLRIEHAVAVPPGSDEVLLERIVLANLSGEDKSVRYFHYWDVAGWVVRHRDPVSSTSDWDAAPVRTRWDAELGALVAESIAAPGDLDVPSLTDDPSPKTWFLAFLDDPPEHWETVQDAFFGAGDRRLPEGVAVGALGDGSGTLAGPEATFAAQQDLALRPGERRELTVLYGIAPRGEEGAVIGRHRGARDPRRLVAAEWAARIPRLDLPEERWLGREVAWSTYSLLSGMLREDWFQTRVINQGSLYLYEWGANAGPRAALRHVLPVVYLEPASARDVLVYYLRAMRPSGELSYATAGYGGWQPFGFLPSDSGLWLLWAAAEYVFATRDFAFLEESHDFYCDEGRGRCGRATAYEMLARAYRWQNDVVATGAHGLVRLLDSDWDDFLTSFSPEVDPARTEELGESTMNTAIAVVAYPMFAALAERRGDAVLAAEVRERARALAAALRDQWRGDFFNRAYVATRDGRAIEVGAENLWLASNGIALLADVALAPDDWARLVARMRSDLFEPSPLGLASQGAPITPGLGVAGFWYSLAGPAVEGLAQRRDVPGARALAWDAFRRQTLAAHAEAYPHVWYGVWSGPDMYFTPLDADPPTSQPGETWCFPNVLCMRDFPVANAFSHSETLIGSVRLAGLRADARGLEIDPVFPFTDFAWSSPAFAVEWSAAEARGRVTALGDDVLEMRVRVPGGASDGVTVRVDGRATASRVEGGFAVFALPVQRGVAATWSVASSPAPAP